MHRWWIKNNWVYSLGIGFIVMNIIYFTRLMQVADKGVIRAMIDVDITIAKMHLTDKTYQNKVDSDFELGWSVMDDPNKWVLYDGYLIMFIVLKFVFTALTLSCPIPGGIFTPTFAMGAVVGQLYASILIRVLSFFELSNIIQFRGVYSILGAAAFCGSVTRTVSVAMIVLELNGHLSHAVPTMVCVLTSYTISEWIKPESFFEMLSHLGGLDAKIAAKGKIILKDLIDQMPEYKEL